MGLLAPGFVKRKRVAQFLPESLLTPGLVAQFLPVCLLTPEFV